MTDSGRRFLAPTAQGTGDGLTLANAAVFTSRLTIEAALRTAALADMGREVTDGVLASNTTVTSEDADFTVADEGVVIVGEGIPIDTTIVSVDSATSVTISNAATETETGVALRIGGVKASGTANDIMTEICWRADLGPYNMTAGFSVNSTHGGVSESRKLRHVSVDDTGAYIESSVTVDYGAVFDQLEAYVTSLPTSAPGIIDTADPEAVAWEIDWDEAFSATGEDDVALFVGTRSADPRTAEQKHLQLNLRSVTSYASTLDLQETSVPVDPGHAMDSFTGDVVDLEFGPWVLGINFEGGAGSCDYVIWEGFKWKQFQFVFNSSSSTRVITSYKLKNIFFENIKSLQRFTAGKYTGFEVEGCYGQGWSQSLARIDTGSGWKWSHMYCDAQFFLGDPICGSIWYGSNDLFATGRVENCAFRNMWDMPASSGGYVQGDGTGGNRGGCNQEWYNVVISVCGDGGVDTKGHARNPNLPAGSFENFIVHHAKDSFRLWGGGPAAFGIKDPVTNSTADYFKLLNAHSVGPLDAHLGFNGGNADWELTDGLPGMIDNPQLPGNLKSQPVVIGADSAFDHTLATFRNFSTLLNPDNETLTQRDNTATYPTIEVAEALGKKQLRLQEVSSPAWSGDILLDDVEYDGETIIVAATQTVHLEVTEAVSNTVRFSLRPPEVAEVEPDGDAEADVVFGDVP